MQSVQGRRRNYVVVKFSIKVECLARGVGFTTLNEKENIKTAGWMNAAAAAGCG